MRPFLFWPSNNFRKDVNGPEAVWPYFYAGTMGLVQRDNIECFRHAMKYSRQHSTFCVTLADTGWAAAVGGKRGVDAREIGDSEVVVVHTLGVRVDASELVAT